MRRTLQLAASLGLVASATMLATANARAASDQDQNLALLNRVTWGATASSEAELEALGRDRWLERQLHPAAGDHLPPAVQAEIDAMPATRTPMDKLDYTSLAQFKAARAIADIPRREAAISAGHKVEYDTGRQFEAREILRDIYSPDQLKEQMAWFWFNQFNVHSSKADLQVTVGDYAETIRARSLGKFRDLLEETLRHPAMLRYLENADNAVGHLNENYAREIMELHTMGVGSGYTQHDVQELARILTGVGLDYNPEYTPKLSPERQSQYIRDGMFEFNPARHDYGDKVFLGHVIKGSGFGEVDQALDILVHEPATARHICTRIAMFMAADNPPPSLVRKMTATFQSSDGDIAAVLDTMFHSPEFKASLGTKFKDPNQYVISAVRLAYGDKVILNVQPVWLWINILGEQRFSHDSPDGFSLVASGWDSPGQLAKRFEIAREIGSSSSNMFKPADQPGAVAEPAFPQLQNALYFRSIAGTLAPPTRDALTQAVSSQDWNSLFLSSPEFMRR